MKKCISVFLMISLILGLMGTALASETPTLPLTEEKVTFTFWWPLHANAAKMLTDMNENLVFQELERRTNVHIEFIHPPLGQQQEQYNLMVAAQDMPDFVRDINLYPGGIGKMMGDGLLLPLNDLVDQHAPNLKALIEEYPEIKLQSRTNDGKMWGFAIWGMWDPELPISPWSGPAIRADWLKDLGLDTPVTLKDWETVLKAFKEEKGAEAPLILGKAGYAGDGGFMAPFDVAPDFYPNDDGQVIYGFVQPGFKDYLTLMNDWYNKGYIDPSFASTAADSNFYAEYLTTGKSGAIDVTYHDILPVYNTILGEGKSVDAINHPRMEEGQQLHVGQYEFRVAANRTGITSKCKDPELAIKWWDYVYSDEAALLFNWGIEGVTYEMVDGEPRFLDTMVNNEEGLDYALWAWKYKLFNGPYQFNMWAMPEEQVTLSQAAIATWAEGNDRGHHMPPVERAPEDVEEYSNIMSEITTYRDQMVLKFIMGVEPLENFDTYVETLNELGLPKAIEIQQRALELYYAR